MNDEKVKAMKKKAMLSQPMDGKTDDEIVATRKMVELPRDKDGREVPLDTKELYDANGKKVNITSFAFFCDAYGYWSYWKARTPDTRCDDGMFYVDGLHLTPPDIDKRLEE